MNYMEKVPVRELASGKWYGILTSLGINKRLLNKRNQPCPFCGGKDRFRWTDYNGTGAYFCSQCGSGDGFDLAMNIWRLDFKTTAQNIENILETFKLPSKKELSSEETVRRVKALWDQGSPITSDSPPGRYLANRGIEILDCPPSLRWIKSLDHPSGGSFPAMLAAIQRPEGNCVNIQRLWLTDDGHKAPVDPCRMIMAGSVPKGSAIRLCNLGGRLGIGEGVETVLAAAHRFSVPVWSLISENNLRGFYPPEIVRELWVFGDNDLSFVGQASAYITARDIFKQAQREGRALVIKVLIPTNDGSDWADLGEMTP